jgi:hypothetical protein
MTKILMLASVFLLSTAWLQAQDPHAGSPSSDKPTSAQAQTVRGCLQGSNGSFTLTDKSGVIYQIQGDASALGEHVGHEVQITGTTASSDSGQSRETGSASSTTQQPTIQVQDVKHISKTCESTKAKD